MLLFSVFFFQAEDGIRDLVRSRGLGDVYKRQLRDRALHAFELGGAQTMTCGQQQQVAEVDGKVEGLSLIHI